MKSNTNSLNYLNGCEFYDFYSIFNLNIHKYYRFFGLKHRYVLSEPLYYVILKEFGVKFISKNIHLFAF